MQPLLVQESNRYFSYLSLHYNLVHADRTAGTTLVARALTEKLGRTVDRLYRLLGLIYPWKDISAARWSLDHGEARVKASAAEYLDNLLDDQVRKRVMPVLEDLPIEEKVRRGNALLKTRVRDAEDSLAQLVHDEDQIVAASAMHFVEQRGLWATLADDLEYALEHRDPKDWYVFEAASWALAGRRLNAEQRQQRWLEPLPAVEIADRLARLPLFTTHHRRRAVPDRRHGPPGAARAGTDASTTRGGGRPICSSCSTARSPACRWTMPASRDRPTRSPARPRSASTRCSKACRSARP